MSGSLSFFSALARLSFPSARGVWLAIGLAGVVVLLAPLYGILPLDTTVAQGMLLGHLGFIECLSESGTFVVCPMASLPDGYFRLFGLPMGVLASVFQRTFDVDASTGYNLAGLVFLSVGTVSMWALLRMLGTRAPWAFIGTLIFFWLPIVHGKYYFGFMMWGYVLLPACAAAAVLHWQSRRALATTGLLIVVMLIQIFQEPYSFVMALAFGTIYAVVHLLYQGWHESRTTFYKMAGWLLSVVIAVVVYKLYIRDAAESGVMPLDVMRSHGIDLIAFFARPTRLFWLDLPWGFRHLSSYKFYGGGWGQSLMHSYLGIGLIVGIALFLAFTRFWSSPRLMSLLLIAICAFLLSLGPSLKVNSQRSGEDGARPAWSQLMPPEAAVVEMPYSFVYGLPPFKYMRSVGRWHLLFALSAVAMAMIGFSCVSRRGTTGAVAATVLVAWLAVEYAPDYPARAHNAKMAKASFNRLNGAAVSELSKLVRPSERVLFIDGDPMFPMFEYLSLYLCARIGCRTFNAVGDKNLEIARQSWPQPLRDALSPLHSGEEQAALLAKLLRSGLLDAVVLVNFNLRNDSFNWKLDSTEVAAAAERLLSPYTILPQLSINKGTYFSVIRASDRMPTLGIAE